MLAETATLVFIPGAAVKINFKDSSFPVQKIKHIKNFGCLYLLCPKKRIEQLREAEALFYQRRGSNSWRVSEDFCHQVKPQDWELRVQGGVPLLSQCMKPASCGLSRNHGLLVTFSPENSSC